MLSRKGITPVIAVVMLVLIVVSLVGGIFIWLQGVMDETQEGLGEEITGETEAMAKDASIDHVSCDDDGNVDEIYIRNEGSMDLEDGDISVYIGGSREGGFPDNGDLEPGGVESMDITEVVGSTVEITGPGATADSEDC